MNIKTKIFVLAFIVLFVSVNVVGASDDFASDNMNETPTLNDNTKHDVVLNEKVNEKTLNNENKLSLDINVDNSSGVIKYIENNDYGMPEFDYETVYIEGLKVRSDYVQGLEFVFNGSIDNVMSNTPFSIQSQYTVASISGGRINYHVNETHNYSITNYTSKTPITMNINVKTVNDFYLFTLDIINRNTSKKVLNNAIVEFYGVYWGYNFPNCTLVDSKNVTNGRVNFTIKRNDTAFPLLFKYQSKNYTGYYIYNGVNETYTSMNSYPYYIPHSENIQFNVTVKTKNNFSSINEGNVTFKLYTKNDTRNFKWVLNETIGISKVNNSRAYINYAIPDKYKGESILITADYSGTKNIESSSTYVLTHVASRYPVKASVNYIKGRLGASVVLSANFTSMNKPLTNAPVAIKINGITIAHTKVVNGSVKLNYTLNTKMFSKGRYNLTFVCGETWNTSTIKVNNSLDVVGFDSRILYNTTRTKVGDIITLNVKITNNSKNYSPSNGLIGFKIDGITYKNADGPLITKIINGEAKITFIATKEFIGTHNITFTYSGNYQFNSAKTTFSNAFIVENGTNKLYDSKISFNKTNTKIGNKIVLNVSVSDMSERYYSSTGLVGLKINGITYKDNVGNPVIARIHNGIAKFEFTPTNNLIGTNNATITFSGTQVLKTNKKTFNNALTINKN